MDCLAFIRITIIIICIGSERRCGQLKKTTDLFIFHLPTYLSQTHNDVQKKTWNVVTATELFRNGHHHLFKPGKSIRQTCLSIFYTHPPCRRVVFQIIILQAQSVPERMQRLEFPFAGINVSVSLSLSLFVVDKLNPIDGDDDDDINTSHNHTNIYPTNALLMSHPIHPVLPRINSLPILLLLLLHSNSEVFVADSFG